MENEKMKRRSAIICNVLVMFASAICIFLLGAGLFEETTVILKGFIILILVIYIVLFQRSFNELCDISNNKDKETNDKNK